MRGALGLPSLRHFDMLKRKWTQSPPPKAQRLRSEWGTSSLTCWRSSGPWNEAEKNNQKSCKLPNFITPQPQPSSAG